MCDKWACECAAIARLQHRRLDLDEPSFIEPTTNRPDHLRARDEVFAYVLVHSEIEVALPVPRLDIGQPVKRVGQGTVDLGEGHELLNDQGRLSATRTGGEPLNAHDVAEIDVDGTRAIGRAQQLDAARTIDKVEKRQLAVATARQDATRKPTSLRALCASLKRLRFEQNGANLIAPGKPSWQGYRRQFLRGLDVDNLELKLSPRCSDVNRFALLPTHDGLPDGRLVGEFVVFGIGLG